MNFLTPQPTSPLPQPISPLPAPPSKSHGAYVDLGLMKMVFSSSDEGKASKVFLFKYRIMDESSSSQMLEVYLKVCQLSGTYEVMVRNNLGLEPEHVS